jgi:hypothetical protein
MSRTSYNKLEDEYGNNSGDLKYMSDAPYQKINESDSKQVVHGGGILRDGMSKLNIAAYSIGHVYNDF